ncbi:MAG: OmpP1/FadL family transporter [Pseudomonadota bacterium]
MSLAVGVMGAGAMYIHDANATEGYFQQGYGARQKALAGAGVADARDAMALSINPAGLTGIGRQFSAALSLFSPHRQFTGEGGPGFTPLGTVKSSQEYFPIPNFGYSHPLSENSALGIAIFGNGGMNTNYKNVENPACVSPPLPASSGVFCGGDAGVNLSQLFIAVGYAYDFGGLSVGVSPIFAFQMFKAKGLAAFGGVSSDPTRLTNNGNDYSYGGGVRVGIEADLTDTLRFGATYQSKIYMTKFDDYAGLFADGGDFDIPQNFTVGLALDATPSLTLMADYKRIYYSGVNSVGNAPTTPLPLGAKDGPGFGWRDVDIIKVAAEWRANERWTLRFGTGFNDDPIEPEDVTLNILAPGVIKNHISGGFSFRVSPNSTIDFAGTGMRSHAVSGIEVTPAGPNPGHTIGLKMHQFEATIGWTYRFN